MKAVGLLPAFACFTPYTAPSMAPGLGQVEAVLGYGVRLRGWPQSPGSSMGGVWWGVGLESGSAPSAPA